MIQRNCCSQKRPDQQWLINPVLLLALRFWKYNAFLILKVGRQHEQLAKSYMGEKKSVFCICLMVCTSCGWAVSAVFWGLGAHNFSSLTNLEDNTQRWKVDRGFCRLPSVDSLDFTTTWICCMFCPYKGCVEPDSLVVRACLESFVPVGDRKRALWQITDASFRDRKSVV